ncbi:uncharacterized protein A4U43_C08F32550 [Asparagus officinalis]|uniref:uncharacterized protein LOC109822242 n=1 Tax=Asparagus officinalis TaxID=4686 RepID=UPI00098E7E65|nr:uncharacterized protein LOC109822242 [Asparagus officinalis]ONK61689.1 uncharacterized protein A4U43_C08F32550 [Asparagus officinalis]
MTSSPSSTTHSLSRIPLYSISHRGNSSNRLSSIGFASHSFCETKRSIVIAGAKKKKKEKKDSHSFSVKPEEATGPFPEAVLLKKKVVKEDGRVEPEFADAEEEQLYDFLNLQLESNLNLERMRHYEVVYLIHEDCVDEVDSVVSKVQDFIREKKGRIYRLNNWGLRRLAYKIKKAKKANYILMNFELEAQCINEFKTLLDKDERIIRHLVIKRDEAITEDCPPPPEFHTLKDGMDDDDDEEEEEVDVEFDDLEWEDGDDEGLEVSGDGENIILVGDDEDEDVEDDLKRSRSSRLEKVA